MQIYPLKSRVSFKENKGRYGVRRVCQELAQRGFPVNHKRVQRIMNRLGLAGKRPKEKYHSYRGEVGKVAVNVINRDFSTDRPLKVDNGCVPVYAPLGKVLSFSNP